MRRETEVSVAINIEKLVKNYGNNAVIRAISFTVYKGEIFALLGTNGAGKTTTLECIEGIRKYDSGKIAVDGSIGVQLQSSSLPENIKVMEALKLFSKWNKVSLNLELIDRFGLRELKNKQYKEMSIGQKRRLHLALALIDDPDIVFLDEPTAGLDVEGRVALHSEIRRLKSQGKTIVMASHDMAEVESLCDRIAILKDGKIAFLGTAQQLIAEMGSESKILLKTAKRFEVQNLHSSLYEGVEGEYLVYITRNIGTALLELLEYAKQTQNPVLDVKIERTTLEERFMSIAKEGK